MNYIISRADMEKKMERVLHDFGDTHTLDDVLEKINSGAFQSFVQGETWIVTQINDFPQKRVLEIALVVGKISDAIQALEQIYAFAHRINASHISGFGRDGWLGYAQSGWKKVGSLYMKEL